MEASQTTEKQDRDAIVEEMLREGGEEVSNEVAPMSLKTISSAGYKYIWDAKTGEKLPVLYYMVRDKMKQKNPDGSYRFTSYDPKITPFRGTVKCLLHPDSIKGMPYENLGFRVCKKSNLANQYQLERHMRLKHPREWESIDNERKEKERKEDRELQRAYLEALAASKGIQTKENKEEYKCEVCGKVVSTPLALAGHKRSHS